MGQINSTRDSNRSEQGQATVAAQTSTDVAAAPDGTSVPPDSQRRPERRDRRKSLRNSIVDLVNSKSTRDADSEVTRDSSESRKWWRGRRKQSKAQRMRQLEQQDTPDGNASSSNPSSHMDSPASSEQAAEAIKADNTNSLLHPSHNRHDLQDLTTEVPNPDCAGAFDTSRSTSVKGKEKCVEGLDSSVDHMAECSTSVNSTDNAPAANTRDSQSPSSSTSNGNSTSSSQVREECRLDGDASASSSDHAAPPVTQDNFLRQFPPSGTLVLVQGVVQIDRAPSLAQDRLVSSLDPRGSLFDSISGTRPSLQQNVASHATEAPGSRERSSLINDPTNVARNELPEDQPSTASTGTETSNSPYARGSATASNSVDILGALLSIVSVATAATAASLLSNPTLPSLSDHGSTTRPPRPTTLDGANLPSIARALQSANPATAAIIAQRDRDREERERNRVRSLWDVLRDRVTPGRGSRSPLATGPSSHTSPISSTNDRINDNSLIPDSLFSELARAFNLGPHPSERTPDTQNTTAGHPPAEEVRNDSSDPLNSDDNETEEQSTGTFEQFLIDLQADLRLALSRPDPDPTFEPVGESGQNNGNSAFESVRGSSDISHQQNAPGTSDTTTESSFTRPVHRRAGDNEARFLRLLNADDATPEPGLSSSSSGDIENEPHTGMARTDDSPLCTDHPEPRSNSTSEFSSNIPTRNASTTPASFPTANGNGARNSIGWWRMYRFPPIQTSQSRQSSSEQNGTQSEEAPLATASVLPTSTPESMSSSPPTEYTLPESPDTLVPVIIVGLQSINSRVRRPTPRTLNPIVHTNDGDGESDRRPGIFEHDSTQSITDAHRDRDTWSSRAARAFGRLGRRDSTLGRGLEASNSVGGARAFMIYVFGGRYPPDHQILSDSGALNSFEELWELAEFLGQGKPPVVTDDDIERSGLELFKAEFVREYEKGGRVASNCVDRCLVCLDDYNPSDDLRLMTCKHAFHKTCIDRWLTTGRNNCPACRSEAVKTGSSAPQLPQ